MCLGQALSLLPGGQTIWKHPSMDSWDIPKSMEDCGRDSYERGPGLLVEDPGEATASSAESSLAAGICVCVCDKPHWLVYFFDDKPHWLVYFFEDDTTHILLGCPWFRTP